MWRAASQNCTTAKIAAMCFLCISLPQCGLGGDLTTDADASTVLLSTIERSHFRPGVVNPVIGGVDESRCWLVAKNMAKVYARHASAATDGQHAVGYSVKVSSTGVTKCRFLVRFPSDRYGVEALLLASREMCQLLEAPPLACQWMDSVIAMEGNTSSPRKRFVVYYSVATAASTPTAVEARAYIGVRRAARLTNPVREGFPCPSQAVPLFSSVVMFPVAPLQAMLWPVVDFGVGPAWSRVPDSRLFDTLTVRWPLYLGDATACSNLVATRTYFAFDQWKSPARSTLETVTGNAPLALALYDVLARALSTAPTAASRSGQNHVIQGPATPDRNTVLPHAGAPLKVDFHVDNGERGRCRGGERCCAGFCEPTCGEPLPTPHTPLIRVYSPALSAVVQCGSRTCRQCCGSRGTLTRTTRASDRPLRPYPTTPSSRQCRRAPAL